MVDEIDHHTPTRSRNGGVSIAVYQETPEPGKS